MVNGKIVFAALVVSFLSAPIFAFLDKRRMVKTSAVLMAAAFAASLYCVISGLLMFQGWEDPFQAASSDELVRASASSGGRGGLVVAAIRYWPIVLMGFGAYFGYHQLRIFRVVRADMKRSSSPT